MLKVIATVVVRAVVVVVPTAKTKKTTIVRSIVHLLLRRPRLPHHAGALVLDLQPHRLTARTNLGPLTRPLPHRRPPLLAEDNESIK